jgi:hypothetical protein
VNQSIEDVLKSIALSDMREESDTEHHHRQETRVSLADLVTIGHK